jgi:hypothetical protein
LPADGFAGLAGARACKDMKANRRRGRETSVNVLGTYDTMNVRTRREEEK